MPRWGRRRGHRSGVAEIENVYKKKGAAEECDNSRGILLADHSGKALTGMVKEAIDPVYNRHQPLNQHAAPVKGTDIATHVIKSAISAANMLHMSIFVLFVDLVKAFDKIIRQLVYGWGEEKPDNPVAFFEPLGVPEGPTRWIAAYLDERGHLLMQWGADEEAIQLAQSLHEGAWLSVGDLEIVVTSRTGGRQRCTLGIDYVQHCLYHCS